MQDIFQEKQTLKKSGHVHRLKKSRISIVMKGMEIMLR